MSIDPEEQRGGPEAAPLHSCHVPASAGDTLLASIVATGLHAAGYLSVTAIISIMTSCMFSSGPSSMGSSSP